MVAQLSLGYLWKTRQWRRLLSFIDLLPKNSRTKEAMANDVEYVRAAVRANGGRPPQTSGRPPLSEWSPEVSLLATAVDELRTLVQVTVKAASQGKSGGNRIEQVPRPHTAWDDITWEARFEKHNKLVEKVLGKNRKKTPGT